MDGRRHLAVARKLIDGVLAAAPLTGGDGAPECRSATSRAYYAAFLAAVAFLDRIGFASQTSPSAHVDAQHALNNGGDELLRIAGAELYKLHRRRRLADYEVTNPVAEVPAEAAKDVNAATEILAALDEAAGYPLEQLGAIASAISTWVKGAKPGGLRQKSGAT